MPHAIDRNAAPSPVTTALGGLAGMATAMGVGRFVYTPVLPSMMDALSLTASQAGLIASSNYLGYRVGALLAAIGGGTGRERAVVLLALAASALLCLAMALVPGFAAFMVIRFLAGVASAYVMVYLSTLVFARIAEAGRPGLAAVHFGGVGTGIAASALLTGAVHLAELGWRESWLAAAAISLAGLVAVALLVRPVHRSAGSPQPVTEPAIVWTRPLVLIALAYGLFGAGYIVTATFLVAIVRTAHGGALFESAVWLVTGLAAAPSVWLWGFVQRRTSLARTFAIGCLVEAVGVSTSVAAGASAGPLIGGTLLGGTFVAITAFGLQAGRLAAGRSPRKALALLTAAFGTGQIIGPLLAGYAADLTGDFTLASAGAALVLVLAALIANSAGRINGY